MTLRTLIRRSLRFHARSHFGVVLGAAIGSAALIGALVVGDSVSGSLQQRALERVGTAPYLLESGDRTFTDSKFTWEVALRYCSLGLHLMGTSSAGESNARANHVNIYGVKPDFWMFSPKERTNSIEPGCVLLNQTLASQLAVSKGDFVLIRLRK